MQADTRMELFHSTPVFQDLDLVQIQAIIAASEEKQYDIDAILFSEGESESTLYLVEIGEVEIYKTVSAQHNTTLAHLGPGQIFGELELIEGGTRSAAARALKPTTVLVLSKDKIDALAAEDATSGAVFYHNICLVLAQRLRALNELHRLNVERSIASLGATGLGLHSLTDAHSALRVTTASGNSFVGDLLQLNRDDGAVNLIFKRTDNGELIILPYHALESLAVEN